MSLPLPAKASFWRVFSSEKLNPRYNLSKFALELQIQAYCLCGTSQYLYIRLTFALSTLDLRRGTLLLSSDQPLF